MAEQWIDAATSYRLVASATNPPSIADQALFRRAHAGLIVARALLLVVEDQRVEDALVPAEFWLQGSGARLEQDWAMGDFSGVCGALGADRWRAIGVTFALAGILQMLPFEERAAVRRRLSIAGNEEWLTARDAVSLFASKAPGVTNDQTAILEQAKLGFVVGRAVLAERFGERSATELLWGEREWNIPGWFWQARARPGEAYQNWEHGIIHAEVPSSDPMEWMRLSGVHFLGESLRGLFQTEGGASSGAGPSADARPKTGGGRPPQPWWDDLWCDIWALIFQGEFLPSTQAEIERTILTWAMWRGHEISESMARLKARKLFRAYKGEVKNFLAD